MKITNEAFVGLEYTLKLDNGDTVDHTEPGQVLGFICGRGQVLPGLEKRLVGMDEGASAAFTLEAADGYGESRPDLVDEIPRSSFPADLDVQPGMSFAAEGPHGPIRFSVQSVANDVVMADFNHPLAGERLHFDVRVAEVREPTATELQLAERSHSCCGCSEDCGGHSDD